MTVKGGATTHLEPGMGQPTVLSRVLGPWTSYNRYKLVLAVAVAECLGESHPSLTLSLSATMMKHIPHSQFSREQRMNLVSRCIPWAYQPSLDV